MITTKFIKFQENLIEIIIKSSLTDKTVIIFPSNKSRNLAMEALQEFWSFQDISMITMEDLYKLTSLSEKPLLQDAKRYLLFYKSLNPELKEKYNLADFFASISFSDQFFNLFKELREECVSLHTIEEKLISEGFFADWQQDTWLDMNQMYNEYSEFLKNTGFNDLIFTEINYEAVKMFFSDFDNIIFANQFYFSNSEKHLIKLLSDNKNISLYFQLPEKLMNDNTLSVKDFTLSDLLENDIEKKIYLYSAPNDFSMLKKAVDILETEKITTIVDYDFYKHSWFKLLSNDKFSLPQGYSFQNSEIFQFFQTLLNLLNSMQYLENKKKFLLPLQDVFNAFNYNYFCKYFINLKDTNSDSELILSNDLDIFFRKLSQKNYLYLDPYNIEKFLQMTDSEEIKNGFMKFSELFKKLLATEQMNQLIDLIDSENGIEIKKICSQDSIDYTDLIENFYETLSNIYTIEDFKIVTDWKEIFIHSPQQPVIKSLLKFFIDFIKPSVVSFESESQGKIHFITLVDTRNLKFDKILFLNVTEGILPKAKSIDFLFNEKQRQIIGLKTYDEVRLREKYYFFRTILCTENSHLFYIENEDENTEKSSFIEEIEIYLNKQLEKQKCTDCGYLDFYQIQKTDSLKIKEKLSSLGFYLIPSDFEKDFKVPYTIKLNTYTYSELIRDPMQWFFNSNLGFKNFVYPEKDRLNPKITGIIAHALIEKIFRKLLLSKADTSISLGIFKNALNDKNLDDIYQELIFEQYLYQFPHDFSGKYFQNILFPFIKRSIKLFFLEKEISALNDNSIVKMEFLLPESLFLQTSDYNVYISGKPDMLIMDNSNEQSKNYIIDFKTGKVMKEQVFIYQWLLSKKIEKEREIGLADDSLYSLSFFSVLEPEAKNSMEAKNDSIEIYQEKLKYILDLCLQYGYFYPKGKSDREKFIDISRMNIFRQDKPDFWTINEES